VTKFLALLLVLVATWATAQGVTVVAAGDIACDPEMVNTSRTDLCQSELTAQLVQTINPDAVLTLGDNQYARGELAAFEQVYDSTWGAFKAITYPTVGNHDYYSGGEGYFTYFGSRAGDPAKGYYSFDLGDWHIVSLNSNCDIVGCSAQSEQANWLRADLAAHPNYCTLAYWHHPRFSSGVHGDTNNLNDLYKILYGSNVELILSGHDHHYERFVPLAPDGRFDSDKGIVQFVVGTGGRSLRSTLPRFSSKKRSGRNFGVLKLELLPNSYTWSFLPTEGSSFSDEGSATCH